MPQLYPSKMLPKKANFAANGVSDIPRCVAEDPKAFLYSKHFHVLRKNKSMMLPSTVKEQPLKDSPEKQKPPIMSMFRRLQLEDIRDRELMQAKKNRLFFYISQKFVTKFGSAHKTSIAASVEDFLDDYQTVNIDINDLRLLDAIIGDSIIRKKDEKETSSTRTMAMSGSEDSFHNKNKKMNESNGANSQSIPRLSDTLPLGPTWKIIRQHRSLSAEDRHQSEVDNAMIIQIKQQDLSDTQAFTETERSRVKEIENYRPREYMAETMKIFNDDQINKRKEGHERRVAEYRYQSEQEAEKVHRQKVLRKKKKIEEEKEALYYEKKQVEKQAKQLAAKARAVYLREAKNAEQTQTLRRHDLSLDERVSLDSQSRIHKKTAPPGVFKLDPNSNQGHSDNYISSDEEMGVTWQRDNERNDRNGRGERSERDGRNNDDQGELDKIQPNQEDLLHFKLSQQTFKKTLLQKQEEYRAQIRNHLAEKKKNLVEFCRSGGMRAIVKKDEKDKNGKNEDDTGKNEDKLDGTGNLNHFTVNKGYFVNRDIEKFSKSISTL